MTIELSVVGVAIGLGFLWIVARQRFTMTRPPKRRKSSMHGALSYLIPDEEDQPLTPRLCRVAGINRQNEDGSHRQAIIARCQIGEQIFVVREPDNVHDRNAIALYRRSGEKIGYFPAEWATELAPRIDKGAPVTSKIAALEPFETEWGSELLGVTLEVTPYKLRRKHGQGRAVPTEA